MQQQLVAAVIRPLGGCCMQRHSSSSAACGYCVLYGRHGGPACKLEWPCSVCLVRYGGTKRTCLHAVAGCQLRADAHACSCSLRVHAHVLHARVLHAHVCMLVRPATLLVFHACSWQQTMRLWMLRRTLQPCSSTQVSRPWARCATRIAIIIKPPTKPQQYLCAQHTVRTQPSCAWLGINVRIQR